jgi:hypothetical protein
MADLCEGCTDHLEAALEADDPNVKNYHIREVLQAAEDTTDDVELEPLAE